jgi:hypothetical protein
MNPTYWLLIAIVAMVVVCFFVSLIAYQIGYDQGHLDAEPDRHTHRKGDPPSPLPRPGRLPLIVAPGPTLDPFNPAETAWRFAGGWDEGPSGSAEYELLTQTAEQPVTDDGIPEEWCTEAGDFPGSLDRPAADDAETPSGFTRRMAREVEAMIAAWEGDTNYWLHTHRADT